MIWRSFLLLFLNKNIFSFYNISFFTYLVVFVGQNSTFSWDQIWSIIFDNFDQEVNTFIMWSKPKTSLLANFNLMNNLLAAIAIMRSKVFMHRWLIIRAKITHKCNLINLNKFNLMTVLAASQLFMRSKFKRALLANFDRMIIVVTNKLFITLKFAKNAFLNFDCMKNVAIRKSNNY